MCRAHTTIPIVLGDDRGLPEPGRTCLHLVAKHGKPEAIRQVLRWGLSAYDAEVDGNLPVHLSIIYGHGEAFELLLDDR